MILHDAQNTVASDLHRFRVLNCGRRFGKTTLAVEEIKGKAIAIPCRIAYIAPTYQQARDIAWTQLKSELAPVIVSANESRLEITVTTVNGGQSIIVLRGWESIETLRGQQFAFVVLDEVASMRNFNESWQEVIRPTLTDTKGEAMFISTPKGFNHFYDLYNLEHTDTDYKSFHFTSYDNPVIPKEELDKARLEVTEDRFAQEYLADFRKMEGLVYKEFNREVHLYRPDQRPTVNIVERIVGLDFGYTNPTAMAIIERDTDNNFWVVGEYYRTGRTTKEIIEYAGTLGAHKFYPDPAEPDRIEEMRRARLNVQDVSKDTEAGLQAVRELFKTGRLHISTECVNLIAELETYHYPDVRASKLIVNRNEPELPVKEDDHLCDALRYALYMQLGTTHRPTANQYYPASVVKRPTGRPWEKQWLDRA